jgi:putative tryptophan/tyrosine transport system substrate-binding protein
MRPTRRQFVQAVGVVGLGLLAGCERLPGQTQAPRVARIGYLDGGNSSHPYFEAFRQGMRDIGYVEGQNLVIERRWAEQRPERLPALAAELAGSSVDVIVVAANTRAAQAAKAATSTIPIVMTGISDPVAAGLVASFAHPGGNVTGVSDLAVGLSSKRLELLTQTVPGASRVLALGNSTNPASALDWSATQEAAHTLGVEVSPVEVRSPDDLPIAFETIARERPDALIILAEGFLGVSSTPQLPGLIARTGVPTIHRSRLDAEAGGLMSYGPSYAGLARRGAYYVDRILKGAKPADLPVEQPREFDFVINLKTAQALGLTVPQHVLLQTTEVIQ